MNHLIKGSIQHICVTRDSHIVFLPTEVRRMESIDYHCGVETDIGKSQVEV